MPTTPLLLDHSIVGQSQTSLTINKDREFAACRICGAIFQSVYNSNAISDVEYNADPNLRIAAAIETRAWRQKHNGRHSLKIHRAFQSSGLTLTAEAAHKLAPYGLVPVGDALLEETQQALFEAPRAPVDDVEHAPTRPTFSNPIRR